MLRDHWALAGALGAYALTPLVVPVRVPAAINDDWIWTRSVEILLAEGRLEVFDISAPFALVQILWGALFAAPVDNVFGALRLATVTFTLASAVALYALCRELGVRPGLSALGTAAYLFNPLTFSLSYTFLTDVYYTGLLVVSAACYARGLRGDDRAGVFLWAGSVAAALVYLQRATGVLIPVAVVLFLAATRRLRADRDGVRDVARVAALPAVVFVGFSLFGEQIAGASTQDLFLQAFLDTSWSQRWLLVGRMSYVQLLYAGFFALPLIAMAAHAVPRLLRRVSAGGWLMVTGTVTVLTVGLIGFSRRLMPSVPQFVAPWGLGPTDILGGRPAVFGSGFAVVFTMACALSVIVLSVALAGRLGRDRVLEGSGPAGLVFALILAQAAAAAALSFLFTESFVSLDRYLLPLVPLMIVLSLWGLRDVRAARPVGWAAVALLAVVSVVGTRDMLVFQGAVWDLARHANAQGVDNTELDAGYPWDSYHLYEHSQEYDITARTPDGPWWTDDLFAPATDSSFVVAGDTLEGHEVVEVRHYSIWLHREAAPLYLLRRADVPALDEFSALGIDSRSDGSSQQAGRPVTASMAPVVSARKHQERGPGWLGIGAQRSGTTWFTNLLLQHPEVTLGKRSQKELHVLYRGLTGKVEIDAYLDEFDTPGIAGEWTPFYLRALWVPPVAVQVTGADVPFLVLLRDPVDRYASAMRFEARRPTIVDQTVSLGRLGTDALWAGMYATQLDTWAAVVGRRRLVVMQYERVRQDPQPWVDEVWGRLGLGSVPLVGVDEVSQTATEGGWQWPEGLRDSLRRVYGSDVKRLRRWGIRPSLWTNFS